MFGNLSKDRILKTMRNYLVDNEKTIQFPFDFIALQKMCKIEESAFGRYMTTLHHGNYISISHPGNKTAMVLLLPLGDSAASTSLFKREDIKNKLLFLRDFSLTAANIIVAIAAVKALNKDATNERNEIDALKKRVDSITKIHTTRRIFVDTLTTYQLQYSTDSSISKK